MGWLLVLAVFLYLACALLIVAEVFVPSGGLISFFSLLCLIGGAVIFFKHSPALGWVGIAVAIVMIPTVLILSLRLLPKTRFGKTVMLTPSERTIGDAIPDTSELKALLGQNGKVISPLRPVGMCEFDGKRIECVAESGFVENGKDVTVIHVEGTQVKIRLIENN